MYSLTQYWIRFHIHNSLKVFKVFNFTSHFLNIFSDFTPFAFYIIRSCLGYWIHEVIPMIHSFMLIIGMFFQGLVASPAIANNCCPRRYVFFYHRYKCFCSSIRNWYKKALFFLLGINAAENPLTFNDAAFMVFSTAKLCLINFNCFSISSYH